MFVLWRRLFRALCEGMSGYKEWFVELGMDEEEIINRFVGMNWIGLRVGY